MSNRLNDFQTRSETGFGLSLVPVSRSCPFTSSSSVDRKAFKERYIYTFPPSLNIDDWRMSIETSLFLDDSNSAETDDEVNKVPERSHITHEYLVTTLATLCTSEENIECIVPSLIDKLTTLSQCMLSHIVILMYYLKKG